MAPPLPQGAGRPLLFSLGHIVENRPSNSAHGRPAGRVEKKRLKSRIRKFLNKNRKEISQPPAFNWGIDEMAQQASREVKHREFVEKAKKDFIGTRPLLSRCGEAKWRGMKVLGSGGQGIAGVWVKANSANMIVDTMAVKEAYHTEKMWEDDKTWVPNLKFKVPREAGVPLLLGLKDNRYLNDIVAAYINAANPNAVPAERAMRKIKKIGRNIKGVGKEIADMFDGLSLVGGKSESSGTHNGPSPIASDDCITEVRAFRIQPKQRTYRVYMEHMAKGDGWNLWSTYRKHGWKDTQYGDEMWYQDKRIPEPFLWFVLYRLMVACHRMANVQRLEGKLNGPHRVSQAVHQDIKLENVFFTDAADDNYPMWPQIKLGDFGSARVTNPDDDTNPLHWNDPKTRNWIPPEYRFAHHSNKYQREAAPQITAAANVWQCANLVWWLMLVETPGFYYQTAEPHDTSILSSIYSQDLLDAIQGCLATKPEERTMPVDLMTFISDREGELLANMKTMDVAQEMTDFQIFGTNSINLYKIGMMCGSPEVSTPLPNPWATQEALAAPPPPAAWENRIVQPLRGRFSID